MSRSVGEGLSELIGRLGAAGIDAAPAEARRIMAAALGVGPGRISLMRTDPLDDAAEDRLAHMAARRAAREPLSHILGRRAFYEHEFEVGPDVLDPRPETEVLVAEALTRDLDRVLDLGTGSGCILLSLLDARAGAEGVGTDVSQAALDVAARNAAHLGLLERADFVRADWFEGIEGQFDLIVSNPPYIALEEMERLAPELGFEPQGALTDGGDGLSAYRAIAAGLRPHLAPGGHVLLEIGWQQGSAVAQILRQAGLADIRILLDLDGRDRVLAARAAPL